MRKSYSILRIMVTAVFLALSARGPFPWQAPRRVHWLLSIFVVNT